MEALETKKFTATEPEKPEFTVVNEHFEVDGQHRTERREFTNTLKNEFTMSKFKVSKTSQKKMASKFEAIFTPTANLAYLPLNYYMKKERIRNFLC